MRHAPGQDDVSVGSRKLHVIVVVLGDLGRSPRMQYHALSLLEGGHTVSLLGYTGEALIPPLQNGHDSLNVIRFSTSAPSTLRKLLPIYYLVRVTNLVVGLVWALLRVSASSNTPDVDCILVQNPPAVPLLLVSYLYCRFLGLWRRRRPGFVVDWHNIGASMFHSGFVKRLAEVYEKRMAPLADGHMCVTSAMKKFLQKDFGIPLDGNISVLYDCPPAMFRPMSIEERHDLLSRLHPDISSACPQSWCDGLDTTFQTLFTEQQTNGQILERKGRPALVTSSTSWTEDEDFGLLLDAIVRLDQKLTTEQQSLRVIVVVTGKGPMKGMYEMKMSKLKLQNVAIKCVWLEPADYPCLLACADLGVSLHTSTSGLDLPMKILDLFGCEVPVCALNFDCLAELVQDDVNGLTFETTDALAEQLWTLLHPLSQHSEALSPHGYGALMKYSENLKGRKRWSDNWTENALPVLVLAAGEMQDTTNTCKSKAD